MKIILKLLVLGTLLNSLWGQKILIPMDAAQTDHLKAYGVTFWALEHDIDVEWLLNYRGGSFLLDNYSEVVRELRLRDVTFETGGAGSEMEIYATIEANNMDIVLLEKPPSIAVYSPPGKQPWDDAVTLALSYAEVSYDVIWDAEVLDGKLSEYDWLHLHHEDFTGQYGKFYRNYANASWYRKQKQEFEAFAAQRGFASVSEEKKMVASIIRDYVVSGGFLFAMCSATDALDIALSAKGVDIVASPYDGTPVDPQAQKKLNYKRTMAFENFSLIPDPMIYEYSDIDVPPSNRPRARGAEADYFTLFEFSAKWDPVPTMLTQNHVGVVKGFMGQTTGFNRNLIKKHVVVMGDVPGQDQVKYIHGNAGLGTFTFLGGHDPEDYQHFVGDPPTQLSLHKNSPGYRLILNNILFPAAKKKERKT
ncbi:MAG: asparagine synthetase B [Candidatus Marinimicrobia bacterium]|nr:asparagine synthetase B [Candidatus Neomarinimicrobiota bacterium]MCF7851323.1 asparagine synthetase B [Candidatus Neomarinimicrobiota bacterium]MCF7904314.1 asparagine synthetase B [Candidatus Neomarinimicrobiota bacterium]